MGREIKFKLWHKETKQFLQIWPYNWLDGVYTNGTPNKYFDNKFEATSDGMECNRIEGKSVFLTIDGTVIGLIPISDTITKSLCYHDEYEKLEFTGLKDKNGENIYEGFVLNKKTSFENNMADRRFQPATQINVGFANGSFIDKNTGQNLFEAMLTISSFRQKSWTNYEIIGNEFENPELR